MREQLNENPAAQVGLVALLVVVAAFMFIRQSGGGEEESEAAGAEATVAVEGTGVEGTATGATPGEAVEGAVEGAIEGSPEAGTSAAVGPLPAPPLPRDVTAAYKSGSIVVLLFVHDGGIDDKLVRRATDALSGRSGVSLFVVPSKQIARYAAATVGLDVGQVPALVVMQPKRLGGGAPEATVDYGFQTRQGVLQAVRDAGYKGRELAYHP